MYLLYPFCFVRGIFSVYFLGTLCFSSGEFPHVPLFFFWFFFSIVLLFSWGFFLCFLLIWGLRGSLHSYSGDFRPFLAIFGGWGSHKWLLKAYAWRNMEKMMSAWSDAPSRLRVWLGGWAHGDMSDFKSRAPLGLSFSRVFAQTWKMILGDRRVSLANSRSRTSMIWQVMILPEYFPSA